MNPVRLAVFALLAIALSAAQAAPDEHVVLTAALVKKVKASCQALKTLGLADEDNDLDGRGLRDKNGLLPVEEFIRAIEGKRAARAVLVKHGLSARDFGLSFYAMLTGAAYLVVEASGNKSAAARMQARLTREQKANVVLLRELGPAAYASY